MWLITASKTIHTKISIPVKFLGMPGRSSLNRCSPITLCWRAMECDSVISLNAKYPNKGDVHRVLLNRTPNSTQLHPPPPNSIQLISTSTRLHPPPPSSFQPPPSSLQLSQQYLNQNTGRNWAISPNLGQKIKNCPFWLKIGTHGKLEVLIPNPDLDFWNSDPKIHFWANLGPKIQSCPFVWKLVHIVYQGCWFWIQTQIFEISTPKSIFGQIWVQKFKVVCFV